MIAWINKPEHRKHTPKKAKKKCMISKSKNS